MLPQLGVVQQHLLDGVERQQLVLQLAPLLAQQRQTRRRHRLHDRAAVALHAKVRRHEVGLVGGVAQRLLQVEARHAARRGAVAARVRPAGRAAVEARAVERAPVQLGEAAVPLAPLIGAAVAPRGVALRAHEAAARARRSDGDAADVGAESPLAVLGAGELGLGARQLRALGHHQRAVLGQDVLELLLLGQLPAEPQLQLDLQPVARHRLLLLAELAQRQPARRRHHRRQHAHPLEHAERAALPRVDLLAQLRRHPPQRRAHLRRRLHVRLDVAVGLGRRAAPAPRRLHPDHADAAALVRLHPRLLKRALRGRQHLFGGDRRVLRAEGHRERAALRARAQQREEPLLQLEQQPRQLGHAQQPPDAAARAAQQVGAVLPRPLRQPRRRVALRRDQVRPRPCGLLLVQAQLEHALVAVVGVVPARAALVARRDLGAHVPAARPHVGPQRLRVEGEAPASDAERQRGRRALGVRVLVVLDVADDVVVEDAVADRDHNLDLALEQRLVPPLGLVAPARRPLALLRVLARLRHLRLEGRVPREDPRRTGDGAAAHAPPARLEVAAPAHLLGGDQPLQTAPQPVEGVVGLVQARRERLVVGRVGGGARLYRQRALLLQEAHHPRAALLGRGVATTTFRRRRLGTSRGRRGGGADGRRAGRLGPRLHRVGRVAVRGARRQHALPQLLLLEAVEPAVPEQHRHVDAEAPLRRRPRLQHGDRDARAQLGRPQLGGVVSCAVGLRGRRERLAVDEAGLHRPRQRRPRAVGVLPRDELAREIGRHEPSREVAVGQQRRLRLRALVVRRQRAREADRRLERPRHPEPRRLRQEATHVGEAAQQRAPARRVVHLERRGVAHRRAVELDALPAEEPALGRVGARAGRQRRAGGARSERGVDALLRARRFEARALVGARDGGGEVGDLPQLDQLLVQHLLGAPVALVELLPHDRVRARRVAAAAAHPPVRQPLDVHSQQVLHADAHVGHDRPVQLRNRERLAEGGRLLRPEVVPLDAHVDALVRREHLVRVRVLGVRAAAAAAASGKGRASVARRLCLAAGRPSLQVLLREDTPERTAWSHALLAASHRRQRRPPALWYLPRLGQRLGRAAGAVGAAASLHDGRVPWLHAQPLVPAACIQRTAPRAAGVARTQR